MNEKPLVSIVTPVLNGARYLELCIQNVLNQSYPDIEQIFVDGGSTDGSIDIISGYRKQHPERLILISAPGSGVGDALNTGLKSAKGEILGWLDSDDLYETSAVATAVRFFRANPQAFYVYGGDNIIDDTGKVIGQVAIRPFNFKRVVQGTDYVPWSNAFFRREVIEKVGYFNAVGNNLDFWIRIAQNFTVYYIPDILHNWRLHKEQIGLSKQPARVKIIEEKLKQDYELCRQYGGGRFAPRCNKYYVFVTLNKIKLYNFANGTRLSMRRFPPVKIARKILGAP